MLHRIANYTAHYPAYCTAYYNLQIVLHATVHTTLHILHCTLHLHTAYTTVLHTTLQVVTVFRLLEQVPSVSIVAFTQHEVAQCAAARQAIAEPFQQRQQQLLQQFDAHRRALHPSMAQPSRYSHGHPPHVQDTHVAHLQFLEKTLPDMYHVSCVCITTSDGICFSRIDMMLVPNPMHVLCMTLHKCSFPHL